MCSLTKPDVYIVDRNEVRVCTTYCTHTSFTAVAYVYPPCVKNVYVQLWIKTVELSHFRDYYSASGNHSHQRIRRVWLGYNVHKLCSLECTQYAIHVIGG